MIRIRKTWIISLLLMSLIGVHKSYLTTCENLNCMGSTTITKLFKSTTFLNNSCIPMSLGLIYTISEMFHRKNYSQWACFWHVSLLIRWNKNMAKSQWALNFVDITNHLTQPWVFVHKIRIISDTVYSDNLPLIMVPQLLRFLWAHYLW